MQRVYYSSLYIQIIQIAFFALIPLVTFVTSDNITHAKLLIFGIGEIFIIGLGIYWSYKQRKIPYLSILDDKLVLGDICEATIVDILVLSEIENISLTSDKSVKITRTNKTPFVIDLGCLSRSQRKEIIKWLKDLSRKTIAK